MKGTVFIVGLAVLAAIYLVIGFADDPLFALSGCCKSRTSYRDSWTPNGMNFSTCKSINDAKDRDDVFRNSGLYWWDQKCQ
jgi:hypothetical protein